MDNKETFEKYEIYICQYQYGSKKFLVDVYATSFSDAAARVKAIGNSGEILGRQVAKIPYRLGWFVKLSVFLRNQFFWR